MALLLTLCRGDLLHEFAKILKEESCGQLHESSDGVLAMGGSTIELQQVTAREDGCRGAQAVMSEAGMGSPGSEGGCCAAPNGRGSSRSEDRQLSSRIPELIVQRL